MLLVRPSFDILACSASDDMPYSYFDEPGKLIEVCGRVAHKSEHNITADSYIEFVERMKRMEHFSVLEHSWGVVVVEHGDWVDMKTDPDFARSSFLHYGYTSGAVVISGNMRAFQEAHPGLWGKRITSVPSLPTVRAQDTPFLHAMTVRFIIDRGVSHELVRHRPCSITQESTRYCDYSGGVAFVIPPWLSDHLGARRYDSKVVIQQATPHLQGYRVWVLAMAVAEQQYLGLRRMGWGPQQARAVLPSSTKTEVLLTASIHEWRHIFKLRCSNAAHPQMREIMRPLQEAAERMYGHAV